MNTDICHYFKPFSVRRQAFSIVFLCFSIAAFSQNFDINVLKKLNPSDPNSGFLRATGQTAYYLPVGFAGGMIGYGMISKDRKARERGYELAISMGLGAVATQSLKYIVDRTRPADRYPAEVFVREPVHGKSFPSGHTTLAFAAATTVTLQYKRWYIVMPAYLWAGVAAYSRLYAGEHYPSDVLAGAITGTGGALLAHWLSGKIFR